VSDEIYDIGDAPSFSVTFVNAAGTPTSPTTVTAKMLEPNGALTDLSPTEDETGVFSATVPVIDQSGTHFVKFYGTGALVAAHELSFEVRRSPVEEADLVTPAPQGRAIPPGGTTGQVLSKQSDDDFDADWADAAAGGGAVDSVNSQTGVVVLDADDIDDTSTSHKFATAAQLSKLDGVEAGADVTDTANVTAAGALMDSEVDADIKTLSLPANTTISAFGRTLVDDADASTARTTLDAASAGHDHTGTYQPLDADLTTIAAADNGSTLAATTASFTTADESKLDGIEAGADVTDESNVRAAGGVISADITDIVELTQAAYDALGTPDADTLYIIVD
jgi:hypothetical protein